MIFAVSLSYLTNATRRVNDPIQSLCNVTFEIVKRDNREKELLVLTTLESFVNASLESHSSYIIYELIFKSLSHQIRIRQIFFVPLNSRKNAAKLEALD